MNKPVAFRDLRHTHGQIYLCFAQSMYLLLNLLAQFVESLRGTDIQPDAVIYLASDPMTSDGLPD